MTAGVESQIHSSQVRTDQTASLSPALKQATPVVVDTAAGSWIQGTDGRDYLDFTTGIGVTSTGHCHPHVVAAAQALHHVARVATAWPSTRWITSPATS